MTQDELVELLRAQKPVFLNGDIRRAFVRSGGSDVRCSDEERNRFLIDAAAERPDGQGVDLNPSTAFDPDTIRWYRAVYEARPGNRSCATMSDTEFLAEMGLLVEQAGRQRPTRAAILIFGTNPTFRQLLPRPVVDCQRFTATRDNADTGERWFDRIVLDENLIRTWRSLIEDWYEKFAEHPFRLDPATMRRDDTPPDCQAFRESMINLITHQDYSDHSRKAAIRHYADQTVFWNPGDALLRARLSGQKDLGANEPKCSCGGESCPSWIGTDSWRFLGRPRRTSRRYGALSFDGTMVVSVIFGRWRTSQESSFISNCTLRVCWAMPGVGMDGNASGTQFQAVDPLALGDVPKSNGHWIFQRNIFLISLIGSCVRGFLSLPVIRGGSMACRRQFACICGPLLNWMNI